MQEELLVPTPPPHHTPRPPRRFSHLAQLVQDSVYAEFSDMLIYKSSDVKETFQGEEEITLPETPSIASRRS